MPIFRTNMALEIRQGIKAFLNIEGGVTRGAGRAPNRQDTQKLKTDSKQIRELRRALERKDQEIARLNAKPLASGSDRQGMSIDPKNLIWIFGTARVGSTWLAEMMSDHEGYTIWREPRVGSLFGGYYYGWREPREATLVGGCYYGRPRDQDSKNSHFILGSHRKVWMRSIRSLVSDTAQAAFSEEERQGYLVIKEPNGSVGAPLIMEAMPESRMILIIRDPRDVAASGLDAERAGGWDAKNKYRGAIADSNPNVVVRERADRYLRDVGNAKQAYEAHGGHKVLVKYEDLLDKTLATMQSIYSALEIPVDEETLVRIVERHSWKNIPEDKKGEGKFRRKGISGGWAEDLTSEQVEIVESVTAPLLKEFYPA